MRKQVIAGNWKMNKDISGTAELLSGIINNIDFTRVNADIIVCPPFTSLETANELVKSTPIAVGAQNMHYEDSGAYTAEISASMLLSAGCKYVILGHSERRSIFNESNDWINKKIKKALASGLKPIFCVGETLEQRQAQEALRVVMRQLEFGLEGYPAERLVVAYEPVWAIGTGRTATPEDARKMHTAIRNFLVRRFSFGSEVPILYGGSAKPDNAAALLAEPEIGGLLVGGASLAAESFWRIARA